ncbi:MAG: cytochrome c3 family protein [Acidobacteriota bacterium]
MTPDTADPQRPPAGPQTNRRRWWLFAVLTPVVAVGWWYVMPAAVPVSQPIAFNHAKHQALACAVCHRGVESRSRATLPVFADCAKCHATAPAGLSDDQWKSFGGPQGIEWVRVTQVPDHVKFSHRRHVASARLGCASCHADIGQRTTPPTMAPVRLDMKACLSCHHQEGITEDCAACHR